MGKRRRPVRQQLSDAEWRLLGPKLWDVLPQAIYEWKLRPKVEAKLRALVPCEGIRFGDLSPPERNQALRAQISPRLAEANAPELHKLSAWIIQDWGGIKQAPAVAWAEALVGFAPATVEQFISDVGVERMPSWSKVLAFADADRYAIYDTRVAVTLNIALRAIGEKRQFHPTDGQNVIVTRAKAALGEVDQPLGYPDYLALLRALVVERGQTFLSAETTLFAVAPDMARRLMARMDDHLAEACSKAC